MAKPRPHSPDPQGHHARLYSSVTNSAAWIALSFSSRALYVQLRSRLKQTNNGNINATHAELKRFGFESSSTLAKGLRELETMGLIAKTRQGGIANGGKVCSLFRFTDLEVLARPDLGYEGSKGRQEWLTWKSIDEAKAAIQAAHVAALRPATVRKNAMKVRTSLRTDSGIEAQQQKHALKAEQVTQPGLRNSVLRLVVGGCDKSLSALKKSQSVAA